LGLFGAAFGLGELDLGELGVHTRAELDHLLLLLTRIRKRSDPVFVNDERAALVGLVAAACQGNPVTAGVALEYDPCGGSLELELEMSRGRAIGRDQRRGDNDENDHCQHPKPVPHGSLLVEKVRSLKIRKRRRDRLRGSWLR